MRMTLLQGLPAVQFAQAQVHFHGGAAFEGFELVQYLA